MKVLCCAAAVLDIAFIIDSSSWNEAYELLLRADLLLSFRPPDNRLMATKARPRHRL